MVKPALGKGMKDLLAKNIGMARKEPSRDKDNLDEELKINIERYQAQEFDVGLLRDLEGKDPNSIQKGIEEYREAVKKLNSAQTVARSLEGYGYREELDPIKEKLKDPSMADLVMGQVEELRERALSEHNVKVEKKKTPKVKLPQNLKAQSEILSGREEHMEEEIDLDSLDGMLSDLNDIGDAFGLGSEEEVDPLLEKIEAYESEGFFVDRLKSLINEDRDKAMEEMKSFELGIPEMRELKERFRKMDLPDDFSQKAEEIKIKFQYPHMASEIRNDLDAIVRSIEDALKAEMPPEEPEPEEAPAPEEPIAEPEPQKVPPPREDVPEPVDEEPPVEEQLPEPTSEPVLDGGPAVEEPVAEEPPAEPEEALFPDLSTDDLLTKAKEVYRDGDMELSLKCFQEILRRDPENSKARFMIRRLSSKQ